MAPATGSAFTEHADLALDPAPPPYASPAPVILEDAQAPRPLSTSTSTFSATPSQRSQQPFQPLQPLRSSSTQQLSDRPTASLSPPPPVHQAYPSDMSATNSTTSSSDITSSTAKPDAAYLDPEAGLGPPAFFTHPLPTDPEREKFRDIALGPITLHRIFATVFYGGATVGLYYLQNLIWPIDASLKPDTLWTWLGLIWLVPLPGIVAWIAGSLWFSYNTRLDNVDPIPYNVSLRIVSRGTNAECLLSTIRRCQTEMRKTPLFPYVVEVVTDGDCFTAPPDKDVLHTRVPIPYATPNNSRFKARALHYACQYSRVPGDTWVMHLDEESQLTGSVIKGIAAAINRCERSGDVRRVGQGTILYHRSWATHPFLTLADMRRTGDDMGHFFLQHRLGWTIFGLHGSYVLVRNDTEREIGFDVGPRGSITEDAWWILQAMEKGIRTMWVDGYIEEQATQSVQDFLKQRRRWYVGLIKVGLYCPVPLRYRLLLLFNTLNWVLLPLVLPLQIVYLTLSVVYEKRIVVPIRILTNLILSTAFAGYLFGLVPNMREHGTPVHRGVMWTALTIVLMPVFFLMEFVAVVMACLSPLSENAKGFHVVQKSGGESGTGDSDETDTSDSATTDKEGGQ